jgi:hypothetical protein
MQTEKPEEREDIPLIALTTLPQNLHFPYLPPEEFLKIFPRKISETPMTIHHLILPNIPYFDH